MVASYRRVVVGGVSVAPRRRGGRVVVVGDGDGAAGGERLSVSLFSLSPTHWKGGLEQEKRSILVSAAHLGPLMSKNVW